MKNINLLTLISATVLSMTIHAQTIVDAGSDVPIIKPLQLDGPRVGVTMLNSQYYNRNVNDSLGVGPIISQFGWQFEWKYFETAGGSAGLFEFIPMIGGLDQGLFIPSANALVGFRTGKGWEIGCGPNVSVVGTGFVIAAGYTFKSGYMNFPVNFAITPGKNQTRFSILIGWNERSS